MAFPKSYAELNRIVGYKRSMPIDRFFGEMPITNEQKQLRKAFADRLEDEMVWLMSFLFHTRDNPQYEIALNEIRERYLEIARQELGHRTLRFDELNQLNEDEAFIIERANETSANIIDATSRHKDDPYFYSKDRARVIAENESNVVWSYSEYALAVANKSYKQWLTIMDGHERESHGEENGVIKPINEPFVLWGGMMQYPRDLQFSPSDDEVINCRCGIRFF